MFMENVTVTDMSYTYFVYDLFCILTIGKSVYRSQVKQEHYIPREAITCFARRLLGVTKHTSK